MGGGKLNTDYLKHAARQIKPRSDLAHFGIDHVFCLAQRLIYRDED